MVNDLLLIKKINQVSFICLLKARYFKFTIFEESNMIHTTVHSPLDK